MPSTVSNSLHRHPAGTGHSIHSANGNALEPSSVNWALSITAPTRTVILPSLSNSPASPPEVTNTPHAFQKSAYSPRSMIYSAIVTSIVVCMVAFVLAYRWRMKRRSRVLKFHSNLGRPAIMQMDQSTWTLDSQAGLIRFRPNEKDTDWMEPGQPGWGLNTREAMSAGVFTRAHRVRETNCGVTASSSITTMMSKSDSGSSISSGGMMVKHSQSIACNHAVDVNLDPPGLDERGMRDSSVVEQIPTTPLGFPEQAFLHGIRDWTVDRSRTRQVLAKTRESLGGHIYL